jgi:predicted DNA-binding protein
LTTNANWDTLWLHTIYAALKMERVTMGPQYVKRIQIRLTERQHALLTAYAQEINKPISTLVREMIERTLLKELEQQRKREALDRLCSGDAPVSDWPEMERQMEQRWDS